MNEMPRLGRSADEVARIREIVGHHALPEFVTGFDVELGTFDDEPATWIIFHTVGKRPVGAEASRARAETLRALKYEVQDDLLAQIEDRYPYFRFMNVEQDSTATS